MPNHENHQWVTAVVAATLGRTRSYFDEEFGIAVTEVSASHGDVETLHIQGLTAIIGLGGPVSLLLAFSFEPTLVDTLYARMTQDIEVPAGEENDYRGYVAADIINIIVGNCTADLQQQGRTLSLTPPMIIDSAKQIHRMKNSVFISRHLGSDFGSIDINLVGPGDSFDTQLNYRS